MKIALLERVSQDLQNSKDFFMQKTGNTIDTITTVGNQTKDSVSKTTEQAKELVMQRSSKILNNLSQESNQAVSTVTEATEKAKSSLSQATTNINETSKNAVGAIAQTAHKAKETIFQTSVQAVDSVNQAANKAKEAVTTSSNLAVKSVTEATNQAVSNITQVSEQAKASLEETVQKTEGLSRSLTEVIENGINGYITDWMNHHVILAWFLTNPFYSIGILLLCIVLIWGLFQALGSLIVKTWMSVLVSPVLLARSLLLKNSKSTANTINNGFLSPKLDSEDPQERCHKILHRLNEIKQEQDSLLQELAKILETTDLNLKVK